MIVYGKNPVMEALRSGRDVERVLIAHDSHPPHQVVKLCKEMGIKIQKVSRQKIEQLAKTKKTQGILAVISPVSYVSPTELFRETIQKVGFFVVLDHITDPQNVGNILRTCEVFGGVGALVPKYRASPINEVVVKASAGGVFYLKIAKVSSLAKHLEEFKGLGGWVIGIERGGKDIDSVDIPFPCALVLGSEGQGVSKGVLDVCHTVLSIPMRGRINSLNVASAGAIAMWECAKRLKGT